MSAQIEPRQLDGCIPPLNATQGAISSARDRLLRRLTEAPPVIRDYSLANDGGLYELQLFVPHRFNVDFGRVNVDNKV